MKSWIEGDQVRLRGRTYAGSFPLDDLDRWVNFYDRLQSTKGGRAGFYSKTLSGLKKLQREVKGADEKAKA